MASILAKIVAAIRSLLSTILGSGSSADSNVSSTENRTASENDSEDDSKREDQTTADTAPGDDLSAEGATNSGFQGTAFERGPDGGIGDRILGVTITFVAEDGGTERSVTTDEDGTYSVALPTGRYEMTAKHPDYRTNSSRPGYWVVDAGIDTTNVFLEPVEDNGSITVEDPVVVDPEEFPTEIDETEIDETIIDDIVVNVPDDDAVPAVEYAPDRTGERRTRTVSLPDPIGDVELSYEVVDGLAIVEGDIVLGEADEIETAWDAPEPDDQSDGMRTTRQSLIARRGQGGVCRQLWPNGVVNFRFSNSINATDRQTIRNAMNYIENNTNIQFVSATSDDDSYIEFVASGSPNAGWSEVGYTSSRQEVGLPTGTGRGLVIHELCHALGAWHEHSRNDRNRYVDVQWDNIQEDKEGNFKIHSADGLDIDQYDYNSIMHYGRRTFGKPASGGGTLVTLSPTTSGVSLGNNVLSSQDIDALGQLYPYERRTNGGHRWGSGYYASSIAFGDVDGDGRDEVGITRNADNNMRFAILNDDPNNYRRIFTGGTGWGNYPATDIAFGDVDGDGRDEVGVTRKADQNNRYWILDDRSTNFANLGAPGGDGWGSEFYATSIAFGDVDGDGRDEVGITRKASNNARFWVLDDAANGFSTLYTGGEDWGSGYHAAEIAFGDVDGDGRDEVGVVRAADDNARFLIYDDDNAGYTRLHRGGTGWGNYPATGIAFGDVDGDGRDEVGITRNADRNARFWVFDDFDGQFQELFDGGHGWGSGYHATDIAFGDVDGDGREELAVCRFANDNARYWLYDDRDANFGQIACGGYGWGSTYHATGVAIGNATGAPNIEPTVGITRKADRNARYWIHEVNL